METAARLLPGHRCATCLRKTLPDAGDVTILMDEKRRARVGNVVPCGSIWTCVNCARRSSLERRAQVQKAAEWAKRQPLNAEGETLHLVLLTNTNHHHLRQSLEFLLSRKIAAKRRTRQSRQWNSRGRGPDLHSRLEGSITVLEITQGADHGWHVHHHELLMARARSVEEALARVEALRPVYLHCLKKEGLSARGDVGFHVCAGDEAAGYLSKWGLSSELAGGAQKTGGGNRTPFELLRDAEHDPEAARLFQEYEAATKGRQQMVWSPGLKELVGLDQEPDADAAAEKEPAVEPEETVVARIDLETWRALVRRSFVHIAQLLNAAETAFETGGLAAAQQAVEETIARILGPPRPPP